MNANRDFASAVRLERGRVLLAGGYYEDSADLYHPGTRKFIPTGTMFADQSFYTLAD